jgi:hypothetical protein
LKKYNKLIRQCNVKTLLENNLDEISSDIVPTDLVKEFKPLAGDAVDLFLEIIRHIQYGNRIYWNIKKKYGPHETFTLKQKRKTRY